MYKNFINRISQEAQALFDEILAGFNFDHGDEVEIALCNFLQKVLPDKYSICRGYVVSSDDQIAGDDIIIFDGSIFPNLRLIKNDLSRKQFIPIDAVYAYIEVKSTLNIRDPAGNFQKACDQISAIKKLILQRDKKPLNNFSGFNVDQKSIQVSGAKYWPDYRNPIFSCIISRSIDLKNCDQDSFKNCFDKIKINPLYSPDLIVGGNSIVCLPVIPQENKKLTIESPFYLPSQSVFSIFKNLNSIGIGVMNLLLALNYISLNDLNYKSLIADSLGIPIFY